MPARMTVARGCLKSCLLIKLLWERYFGSGEHEKSSFYKDQIENIQTSNYIFIIER